MACAEPRIQGEVGRTEVHREETVMQVVEIVCTPVPHQVSRRITLRTVSCFLYVAMEPCMTTGGTYGVPYEAKKKDYRVPWYEQVDQHVREEDKMFYRVHR